MAINHDTTNRRYSVFLEDHDDKVTALALEISRDTGIPITAARKLVSSAPCVVAQFHDMPPARRLVAAIENAGGVANVTDHSKGAGPSSLDSQFIDIIDKLNDRIRWSGGTIAVLVDDPDMGRAMHETLAGIGGHLREADAMLAELNALRQTMTGGVA